MAGQHTGFVFVDEEEVRGREAGGEDLHPLVFGVPLGIDAGGHAEFSSVAEDVGGQRVRRCFMRKTAARWKWSAPVMGNDGNSAALAPSCVKSARSPGAVDEGDGDCGGNVGAHDAGSVDAGGFEAGENSGGLGIAADEGDDEGRDAEFGQGVGRCCRHCPRVAG